MTHDSTTQLQLLIDQMNAGDPAGKALLLEHACDRLRRLTHKMLSDFSRVRPWEQTDDVLQNAMLRLLKALDSVPPGNVAEFFRLASRHIRWELLELARKYENAVPPHGDVGRNADGSGNSTPGGQDPGTTTHNPAQLASWTEFHDKVGTLPDDERAVVDLLWYQGLTLSEAAAALGISLATIKRRWMAARIRIQERLGAGVPE